MASGAEMVVDLSDNDDDDDCVLESVTYKAKKQQSSNYDNIFKENPLLAEVIEKCLNLEASEGMLRVINRTLLENYQEADPKFKSSSDFETVLKKTMIRLDKDPNLKFSHIKDLCETLRSSKFKKRVQLITLKKKIRKKSLEKLTLKRKSYLERRSKKQKTDVIDLDKYEDIPIINLDQNDTIDDGPIVIDDEKAKDCWVEINIDNQTEHSNGTLHNCDMNKNSKNLNNQIENEGTILIDIDEEKENQSLEENDDCLMEINDDELRIQNNRPSDNNISNTSLGTVHKGNDLTVHENFKNEYNTVSVNIDHEKQSTARENVNRSPTKNAYNFSAISEGHILNSSPEKLLVPQKELDFTIEDNSQNNIDLQKIKQIEEEIANCKIWIAKLDEQEVTDDNFLSPYVRSEKYKQRIVKLYKELCALTGTEATKRREVRLTVIEGHPPGPVKRLETFLNKNIGEDGNPPFPDFVDVVKCVETAHVEDNLFWNRNQIMREASALFTHCGRALQKRRQKREWHDLLSRVKAEECDSDPADNDPELLARLEANRRVAVKKEADLLERYSMMQNLPPERKSASNVVSRSEADEDALMRSVSDESSDESDSPQVPSNRNNFIAPTIENNTTQFDSNKLVKVNTNPKETNRFIHSVENAGPLMPQIIAESITNKCFVDEFGLKINDSKDISNVKVNSVSAVTVKSEPNIEDVNFECNAAERNEMHVARLEFESNGKNCESNIKSNSVINSVSKLTFASNVEASCDSYMESNAEGLDFESNIATNKIHDQRLNFESNLVEGNLEVNNREMKVESNIEQEVSNITTNDIHVQGMNFESNLVEGNVEVNNLEMKLDSNIEQVSNITTNEIHVQGMNFESNLLEGNLEVNNLEMKVESNIEQVNTESNVHVNFESNSEEANSTEASVKTEFAETNIKIEATENVAKILNDFGDKYTVSIFDIEDPFLIVEISDSSDEEG